MEDLFRFVLTRPARERDKKGTIQTQADTPFQNKLEAGTRATNPKLAMKAAALEYAGKADFVSNPAQLRSGPAIAVLSDGLDELGDLAAATPAACPLAYASL